MPQRLVMTTWDPSVYPSLSGDQLILQLVGAALRSEFVLIRDQDLSFNRRIASLFVKAPLDGDRHQDYRRLLEELLDTNYFRVVCMRRREFGSAELSDMAETRPIRARALYVKRNNLYAPCKDQPDFDPDQEPFKSFHSWLDKVLTKDRYTPVTTEHTGEADIPKWFRREIVSLTRKSRERLIQNWGISASTLDLMNDLLPNKERVVKFLRDSKIPNSSRFKNSPRRLLYAVTDTLGDDKEKQAVKRLAQSVFAAVYCHAEHADGVYNAKLTETPAADAEPSPEVRPYINVVRQVKLPVWFGIGDALTTARETPSVGRFITSGEFDALLNESVLEHYRESFVKACVDRRKQYGDPILGEVGLLLERNHDVVVALLITLSMLGGALSKRSAEIGFDALHGVGFVMGISHLARRGTNIWRSGLEKRLLNAQLRAAMAERCHRVPLLSQDIR